MERSAAVAAQVTVVLLLLLHGCTAETPIVRQEVAQQVEAASRSATDPRVEAMKPMLGSWAVDVDATMSENASLTEDLRAGIRKDLATYPFELTITDRDYVSRSWAKTNADHYTVHDVDAGAVTIALSPADGAGSLHTGRTATLRIRDGKLLIRTSSPVICVMSRLAADRR